LFLNGNLSAYFLGGTGFFEVFLAGDFPTVFFADLDLFFAGVLFTVDFFLAASVFSLSAAFNSSRSTLRADFHSRSRS
jgi:hypothetical protein